MTDEQNLESRITALETQSGLTSKSWAVRIFTVYFYVIGAQILIAIILLVLARLFGLI